MLCRWGGEGDGGCGENSGDGVAGGGDWGWVMVVMVLWPHTGGTEHPTSPTYGHSGASLRGPLCAHRHRLS